MSGFLPVYTSAEGAVKCRDAYQAVLERWTVPYEQHWIQTSIGETHVITSGDPKNPPLVLMHALFATAVSWFSVAGPLSEYFRVYAVDVPGEANLSFPAQRVARLETMADWFVELLDELGVEDAYLAGNSYGGFMSAFYAMHAPERVRRLALIGPAATFCPMPQFYLHMFIPKALFLLLPWIPGVNAAMRHAVTWMHAGLPMDGAWSELFFLNMVHGSMTTQILPRVYSREELRLIKAPTLLIVGDRERIYRPRNVIAAAEKLMPAVRTTMIQDAHHIAAVAQPKQVVARLMDFFQADRKPILAPVPRMPEPSLSEGG
jgi:pimeloyl-ACP methyl ester carboxylesterase